MLTLNLMEFKKKINKIEEWIYNSRVALIKLLQIKNPIRWINFATQFPQFRTNWMFHVDKTTLCPLQNKMVFKICLWQIKISNSKYQNIYRGYQNWVPFNFTQQLFKSAYLVAKKLLVFWKVSNRVDSVLGFFSQLFPLHQCIDLTKQIWHENIYCLIKVFPEIK